MSCEHTETIGGLKTDNKRTKADVEGLKESNENRKDEINALERSVESIKLTVENTNKTANRAVELMEELKEYIEKVEKSMNDRLDALEANKFDAVKVLQWLGTWRGTFFMCFVFSVTVGVIVPDARDFIIDVLGIATKSK